MRTCEVTTDAGKAYLKAMGNPEGPHPLACEWVATHLAQWLGLRTFECAILTVEHWNEIPFLGGGQATPGPAFATRAEAGHCWGGNVDELKRLDKPLDLTRLIVFDTWVRNCDRYSRRAGQTRCNYDNVFLGATGTSAGHATLIAMDHSHCFTCGSQLTERLANLDTVRDSSIYGAFPQFHDYFDLAAVTECQERLRTVSRREIEPIVQTVPRAWEVGPAVRETWINFLLQRADFMVRWDPSDFSPCANGPVV